MRRTARELNRATLARQLLLERASLSADDAVRRVVALQAQLPASPRAAPGRPRTGGLRRYHHWWDKLPGGQTRLLPGP